MASNSWVLGELERKRRRRAELSHAERAQTPGMPGYATGAINTYMDPVREYVSGIPLRVAMDEGPMAGLGRAADVLARDVVGLDPETGKVGMPGFGMGGLTKGLAGASPRKIHAAARKEGNQITVRNPTAFSYPRIYADPRELVGAAKVAPEDPAMGRLFGVTRDDLFEIAEQGRRRGTVGERPYKTAAKPKGAAHAERVMNPRNEQRILDIMEEARKRPDLYKGMASWYTMDPLYKRFEHIYGPERAAEEFRRFNTFTGMSSPGSPVMDELARGTAANWLAGSGRFDDFVTHGGGMTRNAPEDMAAVPGHVYHKTAQAIPMQKYVDTGEVKMGSAKVPSYIQASGVPETGFQTRYPVGDAHWSRLVGLSDARNPSKAGGDLKPATASASVPEMVSLTPWWEQKIAQQAGLEPVPAQAVVWGAGSNATGVTSPIGAPKLELLSQQIMKTANRLGVSPEEARDMVIRRQTHAGNIDPKLLALMGGAGGLGALSFPFLNDDS